MEKMTARSGWQLSCPAPIGGTLAEGRYNAGSALADDIHSTTDEDCFMQIVSGMGEGDFDAYIKALTEDGYRLVCENTLGGNRFADLEKAGKGCHVSYFAAKGELRVLEDNCSAPLDAFGYGEIGSVKPAFYQYGLYYDPLNRDNTGVSINCGMLYIVRLSDNSLFMVDGGHIYQCSDEAIEGLWRFLHEITGTPEGGTIRIAAWYITHAHGDHVTGCAKLLNRHHDEIVLERMLYNFPSYQVRQQGYDSWTTVMKEVVRKVYPDVAFLKPHSGQAFSLSDMKVEVLYTHEDAVRADDLSRFPLGDYNCTSAILALWLEGQRVMLLGDTNVEAERVLAELTDRSIWRSDAVQVAHHCFNYLNTLYEWISAPLALLPNSYFGAHTPENTPKLNSILQYVQNGQIYYEGEATYGFEVVDGRLQCTHTSPVIGGEYDGSGI